MVSWVTPELQRRSSVGTEWKRDRIPGEIPAFVWLRLVEAEESGRSSMTTNLYRTEPDPPQISDWLQKSTCWDVTAILPEGKDENGWAFVVNRIRLALMPPM
ncbi:MAG: hypothetical protein A2Y91_00125 [Chloroflexi bacterium RBG_13_54_8]|nr:MAG: hypothetical protein A2Y91_00125 [Chloroflexi bacterium RBG_13_54_8]